VPSDSVCSGQKYKKGEQFAVPGELLSSGGPFTVGLNGLKGLFQPKWFCVSMISMNAGFTQLNTYVLYSYAYPCKSSPSSQQCHWNSRYKRSLNCVQNGASTSLGSFLNSVSFINLVKVHLVIWVCLPGFHFRCIHTTASVNAFRFQVLVSCKAWVKLWRCRY